MSANFRKVMETMRPMLGGSANVIPFGKRVVRETYGLPVTLGRLGSLEVRLATTRKEIRKAQRLRFKVFYDEMSAKANPAAMLTRRDKDAFDRVCDHLLVIDHAFKSGPLKRVKPKVVGTYRLLRQSVAESHFGFYTASEFDIGSLVRRHPGQRFLELGRSCVLPAYRTKKTVELLWQGIWAYVLHHKMDVLFGCVSFEGADPKKLGQELAFLHHNARPSVEWDARAVPSRRVDMNLARKEDIDMRRTLTALPPLVKGYMRLGAKVGDGAVVDRQFGTVDVLMILRVADIDPKYIAYYGTEANRFAA
ncbi:MAG: GNAT family N-acetyltransferase [Beijerinckiaceae bacterium]